jgi:hypothetical protein
LSNWQPGLRVVAGEVDEPGLTVLSSISIQLLGGWGGDDLLKGKRGVPWGKQRSASGMVYLFSEESAKSSSAYRTGTRHWQQKLLLLLMASRAIKVQATKVERVINATIDDVLFIAHLRRQQ